jgi:hypothetical protein
LTAAPLLVTVNARFVDASLGIGRKNLRLHEQRQKEIFFTRRLGQAISSISDVRFYGECNFCVRKRSVEGTRRFVCDWRHDDPDKFGSRKTLPSPSL